MLPHVPAHALFELWQAAEAQQLGTANVGLLTDMICCPGGDYCSLANAKSIPVAEAIQRRFDDYDYLHDLGALDINISGCMNACGHHHVGHIGILGVDKKGEEYYQFTLGGSAENDTTLGERLGPAIEKHRVTETMDRIVNVYLEQRETHERFLDTYRRIGMAPFKQAVYDTTAQPEVSHENA